MQIQLPKLKKISSNRILKKKILLISDDLRFNSGVATATKEIVLGTCHKYDWVQIAAALNHPDHGKVIDLSQEIAKETDVEFPYVKQYCCNGYGNQDIIREVISYEKPDALMIFTDPRFFGHVFAMEHELRTELKIPVIYYSIWDNFPVSRWNSSSYASCDLLMCINKQTKIITEQCLEGHGTETTDIDKL